MWNLLDWLRENIYHTTLCTEGGRETVGCICGKSKAIREVEQLQAEIDALKAYNAHQLLDLPQKREICQGCTLPKEFEQIEAENKKLRAAIANVPISAYGEAQREGLDCNAAWDCFIEEIIIWESQSLKDSP